MLYLVFNKKGTPAKIPTNDQSGGDTTTSGIFQLAKDIGVVLLSFALGVDEEDYYNPTALQGGSERKEETSGLQPYIQPLMVSYKLESSL